MKFEQGNNTGISSDNFVRLKDKEKVVGVFRGDVFSFKDHWTGTHSEICTKPQPCIHCEAGIKSRFRFHTNFIVKENDVFTAKIFAGGWKLYQSLKALHEGEYDLEKTIVSISRSGSTLNDTTYLVMPVKDNAVTLEREAALKLVQLLPINPKDFEKVEEPMAFEVVANESEVPF